jgi:hypothetical protein
MQLAAPISHYVTDFKLAQIKSGGHRLLRIPR